MRGSAVSGAPTDGPSPGRSCSTSVGHAGLVQQFDRAGGDQRRLLGRLGDHRIAGDERSGDLAGKDRQRKIPRRDAGDHAARLALPASTFARLGGVVAQEVDRLAHFRDAVGQRLAGLAGGEREELDRMVLVEIGGPGRIAARLATGVAAQAGCAAAAAATAASHLALLRLGDRADDIARLRRIG